MSKPIGNQDQKAPDIIPVKPSEIKKMQGRAISPRDNKNNENYSPQGGRTPAVPSLSLELIQGAVEIQQRKSISPSLKRGGALNTNNPLLISDPGTLAASFQEILKSPRNDAASIHIINKVPEVEGIPGEKEGQKKRSMSLIRTFAESIYSPRDSSSNPPSSITIGGSETMISKTIQSTPSSPRGFLNAQAKIASINSAGKAKTDEGRASSDILGTYKNKVVKKLEEYLKELDGDFPPEMLRLKIEHQAHLILNSKMQDFVETLKGISLSRKIFLDDATLQCILENWHASIENDSKWLNVSINRLGLLRDKLNEKVKVKSTKWTAEFLALLDHLVKRKFSLRDFVSHFENADKSMMQLITHAIGDKNAIELLCKYAHRKTEPLKEHLLILQWLNETPVCFLFNLKEVDKACSEVVRAFIPSGIPIIDLSINGKPFSFDPENPVEVAVKGLSPETESLTPVQVIQNKYFNQLIQQIDPDLSSQLRQEEAKKIAKLEQSIYTDFLSKCGFGTTTPCEYKLRLETHPKLFRGEGHEFRAEKAKGHDDLLAGIKAEIQTNPPKIIREYNYTIYSMQDASDSEEGWRQPEVKLFVRWEMQPPIDQAGQSIGKINFFDLVGFPKATIEMQSKILEILTNYFSWKDWAAPELLQDLSIAWEEPLNQTLIDSISLAEWLEPTFIAANRLTFKELFINDEKITSHELLKNEPAYSESKGQFFDLIRTKIALKDEECNSLLKACTPMALATPVEFAMYKKFQFFYEAPYLMKRKTSPDDPTNGIKCEIHSIGHPQVTRSLTYTLYHQGSPAAHLDVVSHLQKEKGWKLKADITDLRFERSTPLRARFEILSLIVQAGATQFASPML